MLLQGEKLLHYPHITQITLTDQLLKDRHLGYKYYAAWYKCLQSLTPDKVSDSRDPSSK